MITLEQIWKISGKSVSCFVHIADTNGYGLISIQNFLHKMGIKKSQEELDQIRCLQLYQGGAR